MNVIATRPSTALPAVQWWSDQKMVSLVKRTSFKDCNDTEFDEAVAVARELRLSPLRKQIYAFVFNKDDPKKRNMVLVIGIDGGRAIAARTGNYRPDDRPPEWTINEKAKDPLANPHGIECCTVGVFHRPTQHDAFERIVHTVYWDEFAPLIKSGDSDDYEMVETGETWPDSGKPKLRKKLRQGATVTVRLDPKKDAWIRSGRNQIAKCAEFGALRKGWPEDLSRVYAEEETHRGQTIDADYTDLTPSEMAAKGESDQRLARIGGPAILACLDDSGNLERIEFGAFADRVMAATEKLPPDKVAALVERNKAAINEFWAHNKTDALALKRQLEARSGAAPKAPPLAPTDAGPGLGRSQRSDDVTANRATLKTTLRNELAGLKGKTMRAYLEWTASFRERSGLLSRADISEIEREALAVQSDIAKAEAASS